MTKEMEQKKVRGENIYKTRERGETKTIISHTLNCSENHYFVKAELFMLAYFSEAMKFKSVDFQSLIGLFFLASLGEIG
jgi:hypothetical protein